jgi:hypothetical protein
MLIRITMTCLSLLASTAGATAQIPCMKTEAAIAELTGPRIAELPLFQGTLASNGRAPLVATVFANPASGTWTITVSPDGKTSCVILSGRDFTPATMEKVIGRPSNYEQ